MAAIENPFEVFMIWSAQDNGEAVWLIDAWDEYSIDGNYDGWLAAIAKAKSENEEIRITRTTISYSTIQDTFRPKAINNDGIKEEK